VVLKEFIRLSTKPELDRSRFMVDLETQTLAAKFAFEFNERVRRTTAPSRHAIKFLLAKVGILEPSCAFALCLRAVNGATH
jgi:hypothetical protein